MRSPRSVPRSASRSPRPPAPAMRRRVGAGRHPTNSHPTNPLTSSAAARARMGRHPPDSSKVATPKEEPMAQDIASVMTADPITVDGNAALLDAARAMRDNDVGDVLVTENGAVAGI